MDQKEKIAMRYHLYHKSMVDLFCLKTMMDVSQEEFEDLILRKMRKTFETIEEFMRIYSEKK